MIITNYYKSGDLAHYMTKDFFNISWLKKLQRLYDIINGLRNIHNANIIHKDYHSGNILIDGIWTMIGDLGISKSAIDDDNDEVYGIIPYVAPEIFQGQKYTKASDIYSFGIVMWELMTGRKPFWDQNHDTNLIIEICDGLRPPIITNAPEGYIKLMQKCWHSDPLKRPSASDIVKLVHHSSKMFLNENNRPTLIIKSPDIGPITANNPGAIYKSRPLSTMIKSAESTRSLKSQRIISMFGKYLIFL
jgi:serine/threonine protein kinase